MIPLATWPRSPDDIEGKKHTWRMRSLFFAKMETVVVLPEDGALLRRTEVRICWGGTKLSIEILKNAWENM